MQLIERLEGVVERGQRLPLTGKIMIDEDAFLNIIDQMWIMVPEEIKRCREIEQERDKYIARAREEAEQILAQAREDVATRLDEHEIRRQAEAQAQETLARTEQRARRVRKGADEYAYSTLRDLQERLSKLQGVVKNGLESLEERERLEEGDKEKEAESESAAGPEGDI